jgi:hypothetical protein
MRYTRADLGGMSAPIEGRPMALVNDLHHIAFLTADLDRLISFTSASSTHG